MQAHYGIYRDTNDGKQVGDPVKGVAVILKAVDAENLPLGQRAYDIARKKLTSFENDMNAWEADALATGFDQKN